MNNIGDTMKEIKSRELLKEWQGLIVNNRVVMKAVDNVSENAKSTIIVTYADENAKYLARILRETRKELDKPFYLSPYNPAHGNYTNGDCCGIFNALNDDLEVICNECGMKLYDLTEELHEKPKNKGDKNVQRNKRRT